MANYSKLDVCRRAPELSFDIVSSKFCVFDLIPFLLPTLVGRPFRFSGDFTVVEKIAAQ